MPSLSQAKTLGGVGSILATLGIGKVIGILFFVPSVGVVLTIVGLIMVLVAVKYVSDLAQEKAIFNDMLISTILAIVGVAAGVLFFIGTSFSALGRIFPSGFPTTSGVVPPTLTTSDLFALIGGLLLGLGVIWFFLIVSAIFLRRSYRKISAFVGVKMFNTTALLYLIGAALTILFGVGLIIVFVAEILQIVAFFSLPDKPPMPSGTAPASMAAVTPTNPARRPKNSINLSFSDFVVVIRSSAS